MAPKGLLRATTKLANILFSRLCSSSMDKDILAWGPYPKGKFSVAQGYARLDNQCNRVRRFPSGRRFGIDSLG